VETAEPTARAPLCAHAWPTPCQVSPTVSDTRVHNG
jgi:hypothetical protein